MLTEVARDLWIAEGDAVPFFGIPYPTRMTVARLSDGGLWVYSPIRLEDRLAEEIRKLGPVRHLVSPNKLHHLFMGEWSEAWPDARMCASPGLRRRRKDLRFDATLGDTPEPAWAEEIDQVIFHGSFAMEEVVFFHRDSRSLIVADLIQKFDPSTLTGAQRLIMRLDGMVGPSGSTPREWRLSFWNRAAARRALSQALAWNPERIILAHGIWIRSDGREVLRRSLGWLRPRDPAASREEASQPAAVRTG
jgi:hypothetical protein